MLRTSSGDRNVSQPKDIADQNVPQHQNATFVVPNMFMDGIIFIMIPSPKLCNDKYSMVEEACKLAIEAPDRRQALAGTHAGARSVCQLPSGPSLEIDPQTRQALSPGFCFMLVSQISNMLLYWHIYNIDYSPKYT